MPKPTLRTATPEQIQSALESAEHICPTCGVGFTPVRHWQSFCSEKCRRNFHNATSIIARLEEQRQSEVKDLKDKIKALQQKVEDLEKELKAYK